MIEWSDLEQLDILKADWYGIEQGKKIQKIRPTLFWLNHPDRSFWVIYLTRSKKYDGKGNPHIGPIVDPDVISYVISKHPCNIPRSFVKQYYHKRLEPIIKDNLMQILAVVVT